MGSLFNVDAVTGSITTAGGITSTSTTTGFLLPQLTTVQRNAISSPQTGLEIFNTDTVQIEFWNGSAWTAVGSSGITQLTGDVTAGPGSGSQVATIAPNAVTQILQSSNQSNVGSTPYTNIIDSKTITTSGGSVLIMASVSGNFTKGSFASIAEVQVALWRDSGTTPLSIQRYEQPGWTNSTSINAGFSLVAVDTPTAGTYTYKVGWAGADLTIPGSPISADNLVVIEFKK